ncbi:MAG: hypothetical protein LBT21_05015 [Oscillospiraceae bacterium]|jgi:major membrane immunogen (membrane-anchored lipoprotein)|nr:hypothetical protein [Oscillospiraceae bacterium]
MKKAGTIVIAVLLMLSLLAACGFLPKPMDGTYKSDGESLLSKTWIFSGSNQLTIKNGIDSLAIASNGTYTIHKGTLTFVSDGLPSITTNYTITEITFKSFFIDGAKFTKQ